MEKEEREKREAYHDEQLRKGSAPPAVTHTVPKAAAGKSLEEQVKQAVPVEKLSV